MSHWMKSRLDEKGTLMKRHSTKKNMNIDANLVELAIILQLHNLIIFWGHFKSFFQATCCLTRLALNYILS
jgi:hypothetical protein